MNDWSVFDETFLKLNYKTMPRQLLADALSRDVQEINNKLIDWGLMNANSKSNKALKYPNYRKYYHYVPHGTKYPKLKKQLEGVLKNKIKGKNSVIMNRVEVALLWDLPFRQMLKHLYTMVRDKEFKFVASKRDKNGNFEFRYRNKDEVSDLPPVSKELLNSDIKDLPKIKAVKWNKHTDQILWFLINRIRENPDLDMVRVGNKEIMDGTGLSLSGVKAHINVIDNTKDCIVEKVAVKLYKDAITAYNHYRFKKHMLEMDKKSFDLIENTIAEMTSVLDIKSDPNNITEVAKRANVSEDMVKRYINLVIYKGGWVNVK